MTKCVWTVFTLFCSAADDVIHVHGQSGDGLAQEMLYGRSVLAYWSILVFTKTNWNGAEKWTAVQLRVPEVIIIIIIIIAVISKAPYLTDKVWAHRDLQVRTWVRFAASKHKVPHKVSLSSKCWIWTLCERRRLCLSTGTDYAVAVARPRRQCTEDVP